MFIFSGTSSEENEYGNHNDDTSTPYYRRAAITGIHDIMNCFTEVLTGKCDKFICTSVPYRCDRAATFLVDCNALKSSKDLTKDGFGGYINQSCDWLYFETNEDQEFISSSKDVAPWELKTTYFSLERDRTFLRKVIELRRNKGTRTSNTPVYGAVVYRFKGPAHPIPKMKSHGNSKTGKPFTATKPSVIKTIKDKLGKEAPRKINDELFNAAGGILGVQNETDYARNMKQIYNANRTVPSKFVEKDDLFTIISRLGDDTYPVLNVHCSTTCHLAVTLATDYQLNTLETLCCDPDKPVILGIDMTYNCGNKYYVTPTVIQHPMLQHSDTLSEPTIIGPTLIHTEANEGVYRLFASDLVNARPSLSAMRFLGSDRQRALYNGFKVHMKDLKLILCRKHVEDNVNRYLATQHNLSSAHKLDFFNDIFTDLIECLDERDFTECVQDLKYKWDEMSPSLYTWFMKYQFDSFKNSLIQGCRNEAGLIGKHYYNNACESANSVFKRYVDRRTPLSKLVDEWSSLINSQQNNLDRAVIDEGNFRFKSVYRHLLVEKHLFFRKSEQERKTVLGRVLKGYKNINTTSVIVSNSYNLTDAATSYVSSGAGHKINERPRKRKSRVLSSEYCANPQVHDSSVIFKDRNNPIPKVSRKISVCYACDQDYTRNDENIVGCVKTYRRYFKDGKMCVSKKLQNVYVHLRCLTHSDYLGKAVHICNYMNEILTPEQYQMIRDSLGQFSL